MTSVIGASIKLHFLSITISTGGPDIRSSKGVVRLALDRKGGKAVVAPKPPASGTAEILFNLHRRTFSNRKIISLYILSSLQKFTERTL
jgi:hypothetical protein